MSPKTIVFIGRSGCGKGTQAKLLETYFKEHDTEKRPIFYVETGAGVRKLVQGTSYTSKLCKAASDREELQPDFISSWIWIDQFIRQLTGEEHILIDGSPRSLLQAQILNNALEFYKLSTYVVYLDVDRDISLGRLLARGRGDDTHERINSRLDWFDRDVVPAIDFLKNQPGLNFLDIDGRQTIEKVHADIVAALNDLN